MWYKDVMKQNMKKWCGYAEELTGYWVGQHFPRPIVALGKELRTPYCSWCGQTDNGTICTCGNRSLSWSRVVRLGAYEPPLSTSILHGKYSKWYEMLELLGSRLGQGVRGRVPPNAVVVAMPMSYIRWWFRGINHASILAKFVAQSAGLHRRNLLLRKETPAQASMTASQRLLLRTKSIRPMPFVQLHGKPVVLVDDVLTTGRSLEVASKALRRIGASTITVAVVAVTNLPERAKKVESVSFTP
jgi:ComF family protein